MSTLTVDSSPKELYRIFTTYDELFSHRDLPNVAKLVACIYAWKKNHKATCSSPAEAFEQHRQATLHPPKRGPRIARPKQEVVNVNDGDHSASNDSDDDVVLASQISAAPSLPAVPKKKEVRHPVSSASSSSPSPPPPSSAPLEDEQYDAVLQRLGARPWLSEKELKARTAADADFIPPSWEMLAAAFYASQDSAESVRRYGIPLTDVQWVERVREHADEYFGERDNFEVLQLDDRPFPDTIIIASALRANVPMRPDPLQVLRREQAKTDNSRVLQLQDSLRSIYQEFRSYKDNEALRTEAVISKVAAGIALGADDEEMANSKKRKTPSPQASAAADPSRSPPVRARTESPIPSSIGEDSTSLHLPSNSDDEVIKLLGDDLLFLFFMASNDSLKRVKRGEQPMTDAEYLKHVSDQISASRHAEVKVQRRRAYDQLALSARPFADGVVVLAYMGAIAQQDGAKVVTRAELVGLEKRITERVATRLQSGVRDLLTQTSAAVEQTLQSALQQMNAMNRKQMDEFLVSSKSSVPADSYTL